MNASFPTRREKIQLMCAQCKTKCMPKEGDWFWSPDSTSQQYFLCKACEQKSKDKPRAVNRR